MAARAARLPHRALRVQNIMLAAMAASSGCAPAVQGMRIAIQGSGISAAAAAQRLATKHDVTVFESGRGPGGRMSTRRAESYQWDHGAQYFTPKTEGFARAVDEWQARGMAQLWKGEHCIWTARDGLAADPKAAAAKRYVGSPGMNALCRGLLEGVQTVYETRAVAKPRAGGTGWTLENQRGQPLGDFDFLICSDKTAAMRHRSDLDKRALGAFTQPASRVQSARSLALMLATKETNMRFASLLLEEHSAFSWVARDDSKPGRGRTDGVECWVAQASPAWTKRFFERHKGTRYANAIRAAVASELAPEFGALVRDLTGGAGPDVLFAQGHRWGAAFPTDHFDPKIAYQFYLDADAAFAACGDFFSPFPGRVEGGWISGSSLADALLQGHSHPKA